MNLSKECLEWINASLDSLVLNGLSLAQLPEVWKVISAYRTEIDDALAEYSIEPSEEVT